MSEPPNGLKPGYQKSGKYKGKFVVQTFGGMFGEYLGWAALPTHKPADCEGQGCPVHHPSDHLMKDWPLYWRGDRGLMERACSHGFGHPDPDDLAYKRLIWHDDDPEAIALYRASREDKDYLYEEPAFTLDEKIEAEAVHGCDGCCVGGFRKTEVMDSAT
jgi:hypothetical protein